MTTRKLTIVITAGLLFLGAAPFNASPATITTFDRATFQLALAGGTISSQTFDAIPDGTIIGTVGDVTYGASTGSPLVTNDFLNTTPPNGLGRSGLGFFSPSDTASFAFATPISAFGIDINTFATSEGAYTGTINLGDVVLSKFDIFPGTFTGQFLGFVSDTPFTSLVLAPTATGSSYTLDTLVYGNAQAIIDVGTIPEPATLLLFGSGLAAAYMRRRGRKS